jgi:twitching motility protein PilT
LAVFKFRKLDAVGRLKDREWAHELERDSLIKKALGKAGTDNPEDLVDLLFVRDKAVRKAVLSRIHDVANVGVVDAFVHRGPKLDENVIRGAARVLVKVLPRGYLQRSTKYLEDPETGVVQAAEELIIASPVSDELIEMEDVWLTPEDTRMAARILGHVEVALHKEGDTRGSLIELARRATGHVQEEIRRVAFLCLADRNDSSHLNLLVRSVGRETSSNQEVLWKILANLARNPKVDLTGPLLPLLTDPTARTRAAAVQVVAQTGYVDRMLPVLMDYAAQLDDWTRERTFESLAGMGEPLLIPLLPLFEADDADVRVNAISIAARVAPDHRLLDPCLRALQEKDWWTKAQAISTLGRIAAPESFSALHRMLEQRDTVLLAIDALATAAASLHESGDTESASMATDPLFDILAGGQGTFDPHADQKEASDLRIEVIRSLVSMQNETMLAVLTNIARVDRDPRVRYAAVDAAEELAAALELEVVDGSTLRAEIRIFSLKGARFGDLEQILDEGRNAGATDVHIAVDKPPMIRLNGKLQALAGSAPLSADRCAKLIRGILSIDQATLVAARGEFDFCHEIHGAGRYRASIFVDNRGVNGVFRVIPHNIPTLESASIPIQFADVSYWKKGLVLVCGPRGAGKSTTLAALIAQVNVNRRCHVISLEAPVEYLHASRRSVISQRDVGVHTRSFSRALRSAVRQDPDVIVVSDLPDAETMSLAIRAAASGRLVIAGMRTHSADTAIERIIGSFTVEDRARVRNELAEVLHAAIAQALVPRADAAGLAPVFEVLVSTSEVAQAVRDGRFQALRKMIIQGDRQGMVDFDVSLMELVKNRIVSPADAYRRAHRKSEFEALVG